MLYAYKKVYLHASYTYTYTVHIHIHIPIYIYRYTDIDTSDTYANVIKLTSGLFIGGLHKLMGIRWNSEKRVHI